MKTRTVVALWTLALAAAGAAVSLVLTSDHEPDKLATILLAAPAGLAFVAAGLVARVRRPENRTGTLLLLVGFTWFLGAMSESNQSLVFTLGQMCNFIFLGFVFHLLLGFPSGRLETRVERLVTISMYALVAVYFASVPLFEFDDSCGAAPCPDNALFLWTDARLTQAIEFFVIASALLLIASAVAILVRRWRRATPPLRRALTPVLVTGSALILLLGFLAIVDVVFSDEAVESLNVLFDFALLAIPVSFLFGLLRTRLAGSAVGRLVVELEETAPGHGNLEQSLQKALGDPSLRVAYWEPEAGGFVDASGRATELPAEGERATTMVEGEGRPIAAMIHDRSLDPGLMKAVGAAAALALETEASLRALRSSERRNRALLDAIPDTILRLRRDGTYLEVQSDHPGSLAVPLDEIVGSNLYDYLPREIADGVMAAYERALATRQVQTIEYVFEPGNGPPAYHETRIAASGEDEMLMIVRDITQRKRQDEELRSSRARIVEAGDAERRRLERNLHDGAQQRLVSLSLALRLAQSKLGSDPWATSEILSSASVELSFALKELRELARGIHPAVLTDRGLGPALESLADLAPLPVELTRVPERRLPGAVEAAAFYVVSESLANVAKYAQASSVRVSVMSENGLAVVEVADDGVGGADAARGSGLRGLADRVESLDGRLEIDSDPEHGTRIRAEIPCA